MKIKTIVNNIMQDEACKTVYEVDVSEQDHLQDLFNTLGYSLGDVSDYYEFSGVFACNNFYCPYILSDDGVLYNVPYDEVHLMDFIRTHCNGKNEIEITVGYPQAGGPGFIELIEIWNAVMPYLNAVAIFCSISGVSVKSITDDIRKHSIKKKVPPHTVLDLITSRKQWNHGELADVLDIPEENAKNLLKTFGYIYDRNLMQYVPGEKTEELKEKILSVQVLDI